MRKGVQNFPLLPESLGFWEGKLLLGGGVIESMK